MSDGVIFNKDAAARISATVRHHEGTYLNRGLVGQREFIRNSCTSRNEVWKLKVTGTPTGGDFEFDMTVNNVTETVTINFDDTAAEVKTAIATHSELAEADLDTSGGPLPGTEIGVEFIEGFQRTRMFNSTDTMPVIDDSGLTGGTSPAAWIEFVQPGYPGNANP